MLVFADLPSFYEILVSFIIHIAICLHKPLLDTLVQRVFCCVYLGDLLISDDINVAIVDFAFVGFTPHLILTCISTGGPPTTVTWTRDSVTVTEETETVLNDPVTAQYTHTLNVTGALGGVYTCTVANSKPSIASKHITLPGTAMVKCFNTQ